MSEVAETPEVGVRELSMSEALNEALHGAAAVAAARNGCAAVAGGHPFLRKYALYCGGRWPLGIYDRVFAIF